MIDAKSKEELEVMIEGGRRLSLIKRRLMKMVKEGVNAFQIEAKATELIKKMNGEPSFKSVPGYNFATCVNVNEGVVHGIPRKDVVFKNNDVVSVDIGFFYQGFHTDTSFSVVVGFPSPSLNHFLEAGKKALKKAIENVQVGRSLYYVSLSIEKTLSSYGYTPIRDLVGHGIGKKLHEYPEIPGFVYGDKRDWPTIPMNSTLAIEVIYTMGDYPVKTLNDGWTIVTRDGKIAAVFEETVAATQNGPIVLTR